VADAGQVLSTGGGFGPAISSATSGSSSPLHRLQAQPLKLGSPPDLTPVKSVGHGQTSGARPSSSTGAARRPSDTRPPKALLARGCAGGPSATGDVDVLEKRGRRRQQPWARCPAIPSTSPIRNHSRPSSTRPAPTAAATSDVLINKRRRHAGGPIPRTVGGRRSARRSRSISTACLTGCQLVLPENGETPPGGPHHQHRIAGRHGGGGLAKSFTAGTKFAVVWPIHRDGRRVRPAWRQGHRGAADVHQHRTDFGDVAVRLRRSRWRAGGDRRRRSSRYSTSRRPGCRSWLGSVLRRPWPRCCQNRRRRWLNKKMGNDTVFPQLGQHRPPDL